MIRNQIAAAITAGLFLLAFAAPASLAQPAAPAKADLAAPPRSITDIVAILDQEKPDPARRAQMVAAAEATEPAGLDKRQRGQFLYGRAQANAQLGRTEAAVPDLEEAARLAFEVGDESLHRINQLLVLQLRILGRLQDAIGLSMRMANQLEKSGRLKGRLFGVYRATANMAVDLGRFEVAERQIEKSVALFNEISSGRGNHFMHATSWQADIDFMRALLAVSRGRAAEAEAHWASAGNNMRDALEKSQHWQERPAAGSLEGLIEQMAVRLGMARLAQGRMTEAEVDIRGALLSGLRRGGKYTPQMSQIIAALAATLVEQGRYAEAEQMSAAAIDILDEIGFGDASSQKATARRAMADVMLIQRRWQDAAAQYEGIVSAIAGWPDGRAAPYRRHPGRLLAMARTGNPAAAAEIAAQVVQVKAGRLGDKHFDTALARGLLGIALAGAGRDAEAVAAFRDAVPIILSSSRQSDTEESTSASRDFFVQSIIESYIVLLAKVQGSAVAGNLDAGTESFRLADAARGRSVQRALSASAARAAVRDQALAALVRQEQDQQKEIGAQFGLLSNLLALPPEQRDDSAITALRIQVDKLRDARAKTRQEIERRFPDYASLIDPRPPGTEEIRGSLRPGEAILSFYLAPENLFVWVVPKDGPVAFAAQPVGAGAIEQKVNALRRALEPQAETLGDIPPFDLAMAHDLYRLLLQPVEAGWKPARSLFVVSNGALGLLPLGLLPTAPASADPAAAPLFAGYRAVPWLARTHAVTQLPSTAALKTLRGLPAGAASRQPLIGFGDPFFNAEQAAEAAAEAPQRIASADPVAVRGAKLSRRNAPQTSGVDSAELGQLPRLPDTAEELRSIAVAMRSDPAKVLFLGKAANERVIKQSRLDSYKVVAFATHGLVPGELNGLTQPALALSAPTVADVDGDGLLTMDEILGLKLDADWVVLSACNTGTGAGAGAEAASGLGRAFFYAGTRALLLTNWSVHSASARDLVTDLFRRQSADPTLGRAEALRQAMVALLDGPGYQEDGKSLFSYAHPIFWAPYTLMGDGG